MAKIGSIVMGALITLFAMVAGLSCDQGRPDKTYRKATDDVFAELHRRVCDDAVKQYEIVKRNGSPIDTCVHAGVAAAAFLQAKDEASYAEWKKTESADCAKAGIAR